MQDIPKAQWVCWWWLWVGVPTADYSAFKIENGRYEYLDAGGTSEKGKRQVYVIDDGKLGNVGGTAEDILWELV